MSVYKSPRGKWMIHVEMPDPTGKMVRVRRVSPVNNKTAATKFELQVRGQILDGSWGRKGLDKSKRAPTLGEWAETFIREHSEAKRNRPSTIREQRSTFRNHLIPVLGAHTRVDAIRTPEFTKVRRATAKAGLSPKTTNNILGVLSRAVRCYYAAHDLDMPRIHVGRVKVPKKPPEFWEPDQYAALVDAARGLGPQWLAIVLLGGDAGLRMGEIIALEWADVRNGPAPQLVIRRNFTDGHFGPPKSGQSRTVPITRRLANALADLPRGLGVRWVLFRESGRDRTHRSMKSISYAVARVEKAAGFGREGTDGRVHRLRHTFITSLAAAGRPSREIMELAGHSSLAVTERYMHLVQGSRARGVAALESFYESHATITPPPERREPDRAVGEV